MQLILTKVLLVYVMPNILFLKKDVSMHENVSTALQMLVNEIHAAPNHTTVKTQDASKPFPARDRELCRFHAVDYVSFL